MSEPTPNSEIPHNRGRIDTRAVHAGQVSDERNGALMTPVYFNSTYEQDSPGVPRQGYEYSRTTNPTRTALELNLASLESAEWGLCFASGLAAIASLLHRCKAGDRVVAGNDLYGGTHRLFTRCYGQFGIEFEFVDSTDLAAVEAALAKGNVRYLHLESPTNPLLRLADIEACAKLAHAAGALCVVDNTFATPYLQRPLELGADLVVHSLTKYLGGHSDVVGGAILGRDPKVRGEIAYYQNAVGAQFGPMDAFLVMRGTKTLAVRMERHCSNALAVARHLEASDLVDRVIYPGLTSHPQHELAGRQMSGFGGMVSFELSGGVDAGVAFCNATEVFTLAESLGGVESLIEVPPIMTHAAIPAQERRAAGLQDGLVRLSVGIEHVDDLLDDIDRGLAAAAKTLAKASVRS
ncbi:cystathionine gamma-synthase [Engelhardtia mirabilis]|uniref:Cystathionine beta-lyase n=1 Tax=Engelhardtia mirabilis TaxID=2528011 RepID=A0A518BPF7_9BACT|nr:Cystathionine beta-lyase [Planctomycetes bacterium Pla133]QDV03184.1 Cystathionine beta-lyase [Planctomycetes bacterium Pla86]